MRSQCNVVWLVIKTQSLEQNSGYRYMECHQQGQGAPVGLTSKQSMSTGTHKRDWTLYYWNPEGERQLTYSTPALPSYVGVHPHE